MSNGKDPLDDYAPVLEYGYEAVNTVAGALAKATRMFRRDDNLEGRLRERRERARERRHERPARLGGEPPPGVDAEMWRFEQEAFQWVQYYEDVIGTSLENMALAITEAAQSILGRRPGELGDIIVGLLVEFMPVPEPVHWGREILTAVIDWREMEEADSDHAQKQMFIDKLQDHFRRLRDEELFELQVRAQAARWLRDVEDSADRGAAMARVRKQFATNVEATTEEQFVSEALKPFWDWKYPTADFERPAGQVDLKAVRPVVDRDFTNWYTVLRKIQVFDGRFASFTNRPIRIFQLGGDTAPIAVYGTDHPERRQVETVLWTNKLVLERRTDRDQFKDPSHGWVDERSS